MFHEEAVIDGVLCWRGVPRGEWTPCTGKELTTRLIRAEAEASALAALVDSMATDEAGRAALIREMAREGPQEPR